MGRIGGNGVALEGLLGFYGLSMATRNFSFSYFSPYRWLTTALYCLKAYRCPVKETYMDEYYKSLRRVYENISNEYIVTLRLG